MEAKKTSQLNWPRSQVQAEWSLLSRCLEDSAYLPAQHPGDQVKAIEIAVNHGVGPLLYHRLKVSNVLDGLAGCGKEFLQQEYFQTAAFNLLLSSEIPSLLQGFTKAEIPVLWVKGVILAATIYSNFGLRPSGDLDVIVSPENIDRAEKIISTLGYIPASPKAFGNFEKEVSHARAYQKKDNNAFALDLHQVSMKSFQDTTPTNEDWFWNHTTQVSINGSSLVTLNQEANLLYLCGHLVSHHGWEPRFIWIYDVHMLLEKYQRIFDWKIFKNLLDELNWHPYVGRVLSAANNFLHTPIPEGIIANLDQANQKSPILNWQTKLPPTRAIRTLANCYRISDMITRLRFFWHTFFPTRAYMLYRYRPSDKRLWPLLYPYRWSIMLREGMKTIWLLWRRHQIQQIL